MTHAARSILKGVPGLSLIGTDLNLSFGFHLRALGLSLAPLCLNTILYSVKPADSVSGIAWAWLAYFAAIALYLIHSLRYLFSLFISTTPFVDGLLPRREDRISLARILIDAGRRPFQLAISLGGAAVFVGAARVIAPSLARYLRVGPASYLAVSLAIFLGVSGGYWIIVSVILLRALQQKDSIAVRRLDPLRTPAILELTRSYGMAAALTTTTFLIAEVPVLIVLALSHRSPFVVALNVLAPLVALSFVIPITLLPRSYLSKIVVREKARTLEMLTIARADEGACGAIELMSLIKKLSIVDRMRLYSLTSSMPETTYTKGALTQLTLGIATIIVPYIVQAVSYLIH